MDRQGRGQNKRAQGWFSGRWQIAIGLLVIFAGLVVFTFSGLVLNGYRLNHQEAALRQEIQDLKVENDELQQRATYLESDQGLEKLAREELGWVKPGEVAVITIPTEDKAVPTGPKLPTPEAPAWRRWLDNLIGR